MHAALADIELPASVQEALTASVDEAEAAYLDKLARVANTILETRKTAIDGRKSSGIEEIWAYCEDAYIGIDDANRHEFHANRWLKPRSPGGGLERANDHEFGGNQSRLYIPLTRRYTNAGAAKVQEILLAPDERPFGAEPTPIPELIQQAKDLSPVMLHGQPAERDPTPKEMQPGTGGTPEHPLPLQTPPAMDTSHAPGKPLTHADLANEKMQKALDNAEALAKRIHDDMVECQYARQDRRVIMDGARVGTGIMKGPYPDLSSAVVAYRKQRSDPATGQTVEMEVVELKQTIKKAGKRIAVWDFYPDPGCGEDIQQGAYTWEKADLSRAALQRLAKMPHYSKRAIAEVLREDPLRVADEQEYRHIPEPEQKSLPYQAWFFYGSLTVEQYQLIQEDMADPVTLSLGAQLEDVYVQATIVNERIIHLIQQPNEKTGRFPYHLFCWMHREGSPFGVGVPEQGMPAQRIVNSACRRLFDNAGFSAGLQLFIDTDVIEPYPVDGVKNNWEIQAFKIWRKKKGAAMVDDLRKAMHVIQFPNAQAQLSWIIEFGIRLFEETTNIPLITQGWSGDTTPETLGATQLQDTNATQLLRDVALNHDHGVTVPYVKMCHEWDLLDPEVPFEQKQDIQIFARGSTVLVDRFIQRQAFERYFQMLVQGAQTFGVDPKKVFEETWRALRLNPKSVQYTATQLEDLKKQAPPEPVEVTVAKIKAELEKSRMELDHDYNMKELGLRERIAQLEYQAKLLDYSTQQKLTLDKAKKDLAETTMELATQKEISLHTAQVREVATPATEPPGRAPAGQAFER